MVNSTSSSVVGGRQILLWEAVEAAVKKLLKGKKVA